MRDPREIGTRRLGTSNVFVPRLGLGTAPLGGWPEAISARRGTSTVRRAWDQGIRYFDTAPFYGFGSSERHLGTVLSNMLRDEFVLSTKVGRLFRPGREENPLFQGAPPLTPYFDFSREGTLRSMEESRERLGFDRLDIALIHDPDEHHDEALEGAYDVLAELREQGEIGAIGVGMNWSEPLARFANEADFDCFLVAGRYTLLDQGGLEELLPAALERGISIIAGGVLNSGILADPRPGATFNYEPAPEELIQRALQLKSVCEGYGVPLRAAALQFPLAHPAVASVIVGATTPAEVDDLLDMFSREIPGELWSALKERALLREEAPTPDDLRSGAAASRERASGRKA